MQCIKVFFAHPVVYYDMLQKLIHSSNLPHCNATTISYRILKQRNEIGSELLQRSFEILRDKCLLLAAVYNCLYRRGQFTINTPITRWHCNHTFVHSFKLW